MTSTWRPIVALAGAVLFVAHEARGQGTDLIYVIGDSYSASHTALSGNIGNQSAFAVGDNGEPFTLASQLSSAMVYDTAAFPIGSSSAGFTYSFNEPNGAAVRSSPSFGPLFAERPLTSGRGSLNIGLTFLHRSASQIEGTNLGDGSLKFYRPIEDTNGAGTADLIESTFFVGVKTDTATLFATYGVLDKLDVSVAVPIHHVSVESTVSSELLRFGPASGILGSQVPAAAATESGSASGVGDIALRAKYNVFDNARGALGGGIDVRLPTGDETNLLGTGRTRTKIYASITGKTPKLFPHVNFGYTFSSEYTDDAWFYFGSEFSYAAGAEYVVHPRWMILGDLLGRSLANQGRLEAQPATWELVRTVSQPAETRTVSSLAFEPYTRLNTMLAAVGAKFNPGSKFVVSGHMLLAVSDAGLKSHPTPVLSVDYSF